MEAFKSRQLMLTQCPGFTCIQQGCQNTWPFISSLMPCQDQTRFSRPKKNPEAFSMCKEISLSKLHPSASVLPRNTRVHGIYLFLFNVYCGFYVGQPMHWIVHNNGLFQIDFLTKCFTYVHKMLHFILRMCNNVTVVRLKQLLHPRGGDLCVCKQPTNIVYFIRRLISDVDTIRIFIESHKKNRSEVDGKQLEWRNVTWFDPIFNRCFVGKSSTKTNSSLHPVMRRLNQTHKFFGIAQLQQNVLESIYSWCQMLLTSQRNTDIMEGSILCV